MYAEPSSRFATTAKSDILAAELERSSQQRTQALNTTLSQAALERKLATAETNRVQLETRLRERDAAIERLEAERWWLAEREQEEREEKERVSKEREDERDVRSLRSELSVLKEDYADLQDKLNALSHTTSQKLAAQAAELTSCEHQVDSLSAELRASHDAAAAHSAEALRLQSALDAQATAQADLSRHDAEEASWSVLRGELTRQAEHTRQLEVAHTPAMAELGSLRERHTAIEVLREQNRALERWAAGADELRETVVRLEAEVQAARAKREAWATRAAAPETLDATPVSITQSLSALRLEHAHLLQEHGADRVALRQREAELADVRAREVDARATADALLQETRAAEDRATRAERAAALAEREIGFLQALNASYASEEAAQGTGHVDQAKGEHVRELEALVGEYKARTRALETEIQELAKRPALNQGTGLQALRDDLTNEKHALQEARRTLEEKEEEAEKDREKIEELEQTLFDLRGEIGAGRHVPPGEQLVPRASWAAVCKEKAQLEAELKQRDKCMLRLWQVFAGKTAEFREALSAILGVKLAFYDNGQVRVTSQYDLGAAFVFQPAPKDGSGGGGAHMQLVAQGEGGLQELLQLMRNWVEIEQSIPCFLASVTLECYGKWKREQQMGGSVTE
ncbi:MAD-domain-containing protein [Lactarius akahatsu]|uniref:Spindle assembly checkpoint component MAD1 n=1 Tax=Lactarius akahatsu TaxID=416441 RepID=A0AAD4LPX2_9AGAM|nr:MAD-domain-containing protein [Lactarius akahatsu]